MEENKEIIVVNSNNKEYPFERVNFDDNISVLNYGSDILKQIEEVSIIHAKMLESQGVTDSLDDELGSITDFSQQITRIELDGEEKKEEKGLMKLGSKIMDKFRRKTKEFLDTDFISFEKYQANLKVVADTIEKESELVLKTIKQNGDFKKIMEPLLDKLKLLVEVGTADLEEYKKNVYEPRKLSHEQNPEDTSIMRAYATSDLIVDTFEGTLADLKKGLSECELTLIGMEMGQKPNMALVRQYNTYLRTSQPFLYLQGAEMVENQRQRDRINKFNRVVEVTNSVYKRNAELLVDNIRDATELEKNGSILMETIEEVAALTNEGLQLYQSSAQEIRKARTEDLAKLDNIVKQIDASRQRISNMTLDSQSIGSIYEKSALPRPKTRRRGK